MDWRQQAAQRLWELSHQPGLKAAGWRLRGERKVGPVRPQMRPGAHRLACTALLSWAPFFHGATRMPMSETSSSSQSPSGVRPGTTPPSGWEGRRALDEPVLSTAEQELDVDTPLHDTGASYTGFEAPAAPRPGGPWLEFQQALERQVSERPVRAGAAAHASLPV